MMALPDLQEATALTVRLDPQDLMALTARPVLTVLKDLSAQQELMVPRAQ